MAEEILIKIELEKGENEKQVDALTKKIGALTAANNDLKKSNNELIKSGQENSKEFIENTRQLEINKQKIQEATSSRKNLITTLIAEDDSIKGLKARNAELIKQRDQLSTSTEAGRLKIAQINSELDKNNKTIKDNSSALEKQKINIGNYSSALEGVVPGIGGFVQGLQGATAAAKAFIATPIGLVLAAVAAALALVTSYFKNVSDGADFLEDTLTTLSTVFDVLIDRLGKFVGGVVSLLSGDITGGLAKIEASFTGIGDEIEREIGLALELNQAMRDLEDQEIRTSIAAAESNNQIKQLLLQSRDRTKSESERIKLLEQALQLEKEGVAEELTNRQEALRIANQQAALRLNIAKQVSETEIEFGKRVLEAFTADGAVQADDLRDKVKDSILAISQVEGESIAIQEKVQNQRNALIDKAEEDARKRAEEAEKRRQKELDDARKHAEELAKLEEADEKAELERFERIRTAEQSIEQTSLEQKIKNIEDLKNFQAESDVEIEAIRLENAAAIEARAIAEIELEQFKLDSFLASNVLFEEEKQAAIAKSEANITQIRKKEADQQAKNTEDAEKKTAELKKRLLSDETRGREAAGSAAIGVAREVFGNNKVVATADVTLNTIKAVARAYADYAFPYNIIVSVLMGALGAAQLAKIAGVTLAKRGMLLVNKFFGGGISETGGVLHGPSHAMGGIPFTVGGRVGFEAEGGEAIINKRSTKMFRKELSAINQAGGGVAFARGGTFQTGAVVASTQTRAASQVADSRQQIRDQLAFILENMPPTIVTVEDINNRQSEVSELTNRAVVV